MIDDGLPDPTIAVSSSNDDAELEVLKGKAWQNDFIGYEQSFRVFAQTATSSSPSHTIAQLSQ